MEYDETKMAGGNGFFVLCFFSDGSAVYVLYHKGCALQCLSAPYGNIDV
jgi:hypothetical protein